MYKSITPFGEIICDLAQAIQYKKLYGYPYKKHNPNETIKDQKTNSSI